MVKQGNSYSLFANSPATDNITAIGSQVTDSNPNLPNSGGWTINGEQVLNNDINPSQVGAVDELRISDQALSPSDFLIAHPLSVRIAVTSAEAPATVSLSSTDPIQVAIFSTSTFSAGLVDTASIRFGGAPANLTKQGKPDCAASDVNGDTLADLVCKVDPRQIKSQPQTRAVALTGQVKSGSLAPIALVAGSETVNLVP